MEYNFILVVIFEAHWLIDNYCFFPVPDIVSTYLLPNIFIFVFHLISFESVHGFELLNVACPVYLLNFKWKLFLEEIGSTPQQFWVQRTTLKIGFIIPIISRSVFATRCDDSASQHFNKWASSLSCSLRAASRRDAGGRRASASA